MMLRTGWMKVPLIEEMPHPNSLLKEREQHTKPAEVKFIGDLLVP
jgi:hypothetical protein